MKKNTFPAGATAEQLAIWKAKYKEVREVTIPVDDEGNTVTGYFRKPDLQTIGAAGKFAETDPIRSGLIMFDSCFLGGDSEIKENDEVKMSAIQALNQMFKVRTATIKNV